MGTITPRLWLFAIVLMISEGDESYNTRSTRHYFLCIKTPFKHMQFYCTTKMSTSGKKTLMQALFFLVIYFTRLVVSSSCLFQQPTTWPSYESIAFTHTKRFLIGYQQEFCYNRISITPDSHVSCH